MISISVTVISICYKYSDHSEMLNKKIVSSSRNLVVGGSKLTALAWLVSSHETSTSSPQKVNTCSDGSNQQKRSQHDHHDPSCSESTVCDTPSLLQLIAFIAINTQC